MSVIFQKIAGDLVTQAIENLSRSRAAAYQHALLGSISFNLITYFEGIEERCAADYAEHALINGKPRLQAVGDKLDELNWSLVFHAGFCDPEQELEKLKQAIVDHQALPLVFANGDYRGWFVPTEIQVTLRQTMRDGTAIWLEARLTLREFVTAPVLVEQKPQRPAQASEKAASNGSKKKPPQTVKKSPSPRPVNQPVCRNQA